MTYVRASIVQNIKAYNIMPKSILYGDGILAVAQSTKFSITEGLNQSESLPIPVDLLHARTKTDRFRHIYKWRGGRRNVQSDIMSRSGTHGIDSIRQSLKLRFLWCLKGNWTRNPFLMNFTTSS